MIENGLLDLTFLFISYFQNSIIRWCWVCIKHMQFKKKKQNGEREALRNIQILENIVVEKMTWIPISNGFEWGHWSKFSRKSFQLTQKPLIFLSFFLFFFEYTHKNVCLRWLNGNGKSKPKTHRICSKYQNCPPTSSDSTRQLRAF